MLVLVLGRSGERTHLAFQNGGTQTFMQSYEARQLQLGCGRWRVRTMGRLPGSAGTGLGSGMMQVGEEPWQLPEEEIPKEGGTGLCKGPMAPQLDVPLELETADQTVLLQTSLRPL